MTSLLLLASLVTLKVSNPVCMSPCSLTITLSVEPNKDNRNLELSLVQVDGEYARISTLDMAPFCTPTEGGKDVCKYPPSKMTITYPGVPTGEYEVRAILSKSNGKVHNDAKTVSVK